MFNRKKNDNIEDIENEIKNWKEKNKEKVEIIVFPGEIEYLREEGYRFIIILFEIELDHEKIKMIENCPNFLKEKNCKKKKKWIKLKKKDKDILDKLNIEYMPIACILYL